MACRPIDFEVPPEVRALCALPAGLYFDLAFYGRSAFRHWAVARRWPGAECRALQPEGVSLVQRFTVEGRLVAETIAWSVASNFRRGRGGFDFKAYEIGAILPREGE